MKTLKDITAAAVALLACLLLGACQSFTAPRDPVSGLRQDAPDAWQGTPDPLDSPQVTTPRPEAMGRFSVHERNYIPSF